MIELQVTACVFGSTICIYLIAEGLTMCPFSWSFFVQLIVLLLQGFGETHPIFKISMTLTIQMPDAFHHFVSSDNFHCQMPLKNAKFDFDFGSEKCQLANLVANGGWLIVTVMLWHAFSGNSKQLQRHNSAHLSSVVYTDYSFSS